MTGNCNDALRELYEFLDGELTPERRTHIQQHLTDCSPCLETFDFQAELRQVVARKCCDEVPDSLRVKIQLAIEQSDG